MTTECQCRCVKCGLRVACDGHDVLDAPLCSWSLGGGFSQPTARGMAGLAAQGPEHADPDGHRGEGLCS